MKKIYIKLFLYSMLFLMIDQISKIIIKSFMDLGDVINLIPNFFSINYVNNYGAAFSILNGKKILFIFIAIFALVFILFNFIKDKKLNNLEIIIYSLLISGILGNLFDRIFYGYVIDFLSFKIFKYDFAIFNIADSFIVVSIFLLIILWVKNERNNSRGK